MIDGANKNILLGDVLRVLRNVEVYTNDDNDYNSIVIDDGDIVIYIADRFIDPLSKRREELIMIHPVHGLIWLGQSEAALTEVVT